MGGAGQEADRSDPPPCKRSHEPPQSHAGSERWRQGALARVETSGHFPMDGASRSGEFAKLEPQTARSLTTMKLPFTTLPANALPLRERPMKLALWGLFALIAAAWSGAILISVELVQWLAASVPGANPGAILAPAGDVPVPPWLAWWIDPAWVGGAQALWAQVLGWLGWLSQTGSSLEGVVGWLVPLLWVVWGVVLLIGLAVAVAGHCLLGKLHRANAAGRGLA